MGRDYSAYAGYVVPFEILETFVPDEVSSLQKKIDELRILLILKYSEVEFKVEDVLELVACDDWWSSRIVNSIEPKDYNFYEPKIKELVEEFRETLNQFKKVTNIHIGCELNYDSQDGHAYLVLSYHDVVQLTPAAKALEEKGFSMCLDTWVESY